MSKTINEIENRLKKYPDAEYELNAESIIVNPKSKNGFPVTLTDNGNGNFTVAFDIWHEEFDNENDALNCFVFGLSKDCRLKLTKKGNRTIKWTVESNENGIWKEDSNTGLINLSFWKKSKFEFLQNDLIKKNMSFNKISITLLFFLTLTSCKDYYNETIKWTDNLESGLNIQDVQNVQPDYIEIDWDNPQTMENEKWYLITKIKGNNDILGMSHYLVFVKNKYQYRESKK